ncbi:hypothetical protein EV182_005061, partial [Spiromyces aspiralis]
ARSRYDGDEGAYRSEKDQFGRDRRPQRSRSSRSPHVHREYIESDDRDRRSPSQPYHDRNRRRDSPEYLEERRAQREMKVFSIWPPSPSLSEEERDMAEEQEIIEEIEGKGARRKKRAEVDDNSSVRSGGSNSDDGVSESESDESRSRRHKSDRHRKSSASDRMKKRSRRDSSSRISREYERRSKRSSRKRDRSYSDLSGSESKPLSSEEEGGERWRQRQRSRRARSDGQNHLRSSRRSRRHRRDASASDESSRSSDDEEKVEVEVENVRKLAEDPEMWVEKKVEVPAEVEEVPVGPTPVQAKEIVLNERSYGGALLPGEGSAMAAYVQEGKRIPRRGEIGLTSEQIEAFERAGYVMSGSRHRRMNAVRIRKENQVISAEEKRQLMQFNREEKSRRENKIIGNFRELLADRLKKNGGGG